MITAEVRIVNLLGIHARPSVLIGRTARRFKSEVTLVKDGFEAAATNSMHLLMLGAEHGSVLTVRCEGPDEQAALAAMVELLANGFGEGVAADAPEPVEVTPPAAAHGPVLPAPHNVRELYAQAVYACDIEGATKEDVLPGIVSRLLAGEGCTPETEACVSRRVFERERLCSSGIGRGIAVPHGHGIQIPRMRAGVFTSRKGINWAALDSAPVYLVTPLLPPQGSEGGLHLLALSFVGRVFSRDQALYRFLTQARDANELRELMMEALEMRDH